MANREFLMLAHPYNEKKHNIKGWLYSEKMDGIRALWDGGISRGLYKSQVPFANHDKDERYVTPPIATGLWSRYGNVIHAPDWFLDNLPNFPLDGELFTERGSWQTLSTIIKRIVPNDEAWNAVTYNVFDIPPYQQIFATGKINNPNFAKEFDITELMPWARNQKPKTFPGFMSFVQVTNELERISNMVVRNVKQTLLESVDQLDSAFREVIDLGGEGLIVRNPKSYWEPKRSHQQVKIKPDHDAEGFVTGYIWGRKTDKGSKLLGKMGALILNFNGKRLELSGFTDAEREMRNLSYDSTLREDEGYVRPGEQCSPAWYNSHFPIGATVTFKYRELSDDGIPKEARYHRVR